MKEEQKQELIKFLTCHAYPKITIGINYVEEVKEISNQVKDKETPYKHVLEQFREYEAANIAEFIKEKNFAGILPIFTELTESQLERLICNDIEPVSYIIATESEKWQEAKKKINKFELGRIGLEIFNA